VVLYPTVVLMNPIFSIGGLDKNLVYY